MRRDVYEEFKFKEGFQGSFSWNIIKGKIHLHTEEKIHNFLNLFIHGSTSINNELTKEDLKFKHYILDAIVTDVIYSSLDDALEEFRDFFWQINNRTAYSGIMQEILLNSPDEFNNDIKSMVPGVFSEKDVKEYWLEISKGLYNTIPKIASRIYLYALKYVGDSAFNTTDRTPIIFKKRELPLLSKSKKYKSGNEKYLQIQKEMNTLFNLLNSENSNNNEAFNLFLLNDKTNMVDLFLSTISVKENSRYLIGELRESDLRFYVDELTLLINIKGAYLKILLLTEIDRFNEFMKDIEFWDIYNKLFEELKESLLVFLGLKFKNELSHLPDEIRSHYAIYLTFRGFIAAQYFDFIIAVKDAQIDDEIILFNEGSNDYGIRTISKAFEYSHDIFAKSTKSYKKVKNEKDFIASEHLLFQLKNNS